MHCWMYLTASVGSIFCRSSISVFSSLCKSGMEVPELSVPVGPLVLELLELLLPPLLELTQFPPSYQTKHQEVAPPPSRALPPYGPRASPRRASRAASPPWTRCTLCGKRHCSSRVNDSSPGSGVGMVSLSYRYRLPVA